MAQSEEKIKALKDYFARRNDVSMAFVFGSRAKNSAVKISDWDIAVYFKPLSNIVERESNRDYPEENNVWGDLIKILETDNVDLIVLNRAAASIASLAIKGVPLVIKDKKIYLEFYSN